MLANGIKLGYKTDESATTYTDLIGLKEVPEMGNEPEKVERISRWNEVFLGGSGIC